MPMTSGFWQTTLLTGDMTGALTRLRNHRAPLVSPDCVTLPDCTLQLARAMLVRDPDGHLLQIGER